MSRKFQEIKQQVEGITYISKQGSKYKVITYHNSKKVLIEFEHGYQKYVDLKQIQKNTILDPLVPTLYEVGYFGIGRFNTSHPKHKQYIKRWTGMIERCYYSKSKQFHNYGGIGVKVCDDWLNYQNYAEFLDKNLLDDTFEIDKDILFDNNLLYSPDTCAIVPKIINLAYSKRKPLIRNSNKSPNFQVRIWKYNKEIYLGTFKSKEDAIEAYDLEYNSYLKELAEKYKNNLDIRIYNKLNNR